MEVQKYTDPERTYGFGIAVAPDTAMRGASGESDSDERALVSHRPFMPYLLLVFQSALLSAQNLDIEKLDAHMQAIGQSLREADSEIEMRFSRAITMLGNSRDDLRRHVSRLSSAMTAIQAGASSVPQFTPLKVDPAEQV